MIKINKCIWFLIIPLLFIYSPAFSQSPDTSNYEKDYRRFVDSKEPLENLFNKDCKLSWDFSTMANRLAPKPSHTIKYGFEKIQELDIYTHQGRKSAPVIFFLHSANGDKNQVVPAVRSWLSLGYTVVSINYRSIENNFSDQIGDCCLALKWVTDNIDKYGGDGNRIAITGFSAGAYMATILVAETKWQKKYNIDIQKVKCEILMGGFYSAELKENYMNTTIALYLKRMKAQAKNDASARLLYSYNVLALFPELHRGCSVLSPRRLFL